MSNDTHTGRMVRHALYGFAIGIGAAIGSLASLFAYAQRGLLQDWILLELEPARNFYSFLAAGVIAACSLTGLLLGLRKNRDNKGAVSPASAMGRDPATGLHTSAFLYEELAISVEFAKRYETTLTCILFDVDNFKSLNEIHGRSLGDEVLAAITNKVRLLSRSADSAGSLNSDEYLIIMPRATTLSGQVVAERLRSSVAKVPFTRKGQTISVTISAGVAMYPSKNVDSKSTLLRAAAQALYRAKAGGKNKTVVWDVDAVEEPIISKRKREPEPATDPSAVPSSINVVQPPVMRSSS